MIQQYVTTAIKQDDRSIVLTIRDPFENKAEESHFSAIRAGISWPSPDAPAYCCVVGQVFTGLTMPGGAKAPVGKRVLLAEISSDDLNLKNFYKKLTDLADQFLAHDFYACVPDDRSECGYLHDFEEFAHEQNSDVYVDEAFDHDNFLLGLSRIREQLDSRKLLLDEESVVYEQLQRITRNDLQDNPEEHFFAINGLRHVVGSYYRHLPKIYAPSRPRHAPNWRAI